MAVILWIIFKLTRRRMVEAARRQADLGVAGSGMEGHGAMDMSIRHLGSHTEEPV